MIEGNAEIMQTPEMEKLVIEIKESAQDERGK